MSKSTTRYVAISCALFLCFVFFLSLVMNQFLPRSSEDSKTVANVQDNKVVYLTFDDGPSQYSADVLQILDTYKVKATFFVTGEDPANENLIYEEYKKGHTIGVHTYSHVYNELYASSDAYLQDMDKMNAIIKKQIGHRVNIMRFPGGSSNTVSRKYASGIMSELVNIMKERNYQYYDWNASNGDGDPSISSDQLVSIAKKEIGSQNEVMLLMHDGKGNKESVKALPAIIEYLKEQGYAFKVIDASTPIFHHHVAN